MSIQEKVEKKLQDFFEWWARKLVNHRCLILVISAILLVGLSAGFSKRQEYDNSSNLWSPQGNRSELAQLRAAQLFPSKSRFMNIIIQAKPGKNLLDYHALTEIRDVALLVQSTMNTEQVASQICLVPTCYPSSGALSYFSNLSTLDGVTDSAGWLAKVKAGKTATSRDVQFTQVWKDTVPTVAVDSSNVVSNSLSSAKVTTMSYIFKDALTKDKVKELELDLEKQLINKQFQCLQLNVFSISGQSAAFSEDIQSDLKLIAISVVLVAVYVVLFLGNNSPIHNRTKLGILGFITVLLSYSSSFGLLSLCGLKVSGIHNLLPFLLIGIGADDMFVVVNSVDQVDSNLPYSDRFIKGFKHAGPSITITSFTNIMAFFISASSSLLALKSFCIYAGFGILFLFMATISLFSCLFLFDLERQHDQKKDCCGLCCCEEDSVLCCRGVCLTIKQKSYPFRGTPDTAITSQEQGFTTFVQRFLHDYFSWFLMKTWVRVSVILVWVVYMGVSAYGLSILNVDFKQEYFINKDSQVAAYNKVNTQYFQEGQQVTLYLDNGSTDVTSQAYQQSIQQLFSDIKQCKDCSKQWTRGDVSSWYSRLVDFSKLFTNNPSHACYNSYDSTNQIVIPSQFYTCLNNLLTGAMARDASQLLYQDPSSSGSSSNPILASKQTFTIIPIYSSSVDGTAYLKDIKRIEDSGPPNTRTFSREYFNYETYLVFSQETALSIGVSLVVVAAVLLVTTGSIAMSLFVLLCVALVVFFLFALLPFWDLTLNSVTIINVVIALGLSVDYSAHIGHTYQSCQLTGPESTDKSEIRVLKVRKALTQMGSSVFHGAASTFLAILPLSASASYIFTVFFRMWFGIIVFGVANGFILLPVLLSFIGPLKDNEYMPVGQDDNAQETKLEMGAIPIQAHQVHYE